MSAARPLSLAASCLLLCLSAAAETLDECLLLAAQSATGSTTVAELYAICEARIRTGETEPAEAADSAHSSPAGAVEHRLALERYSHANPFVLTPNRPNYVLPVTYRDNPSAYSATVPEDKLDHVEVQFQISLKVMLWEDIFDDNGHLSAAYTNRSFWQAYNNSKSAPFRETNHEPEMILSFENDTELFGFRNVANQFSINHQSNGRDGEFSRSWNRLMLNVILEKDNLVMSFKPWYRIPERKRSDDNPDIEDYMGHFELFGAWQKNRHVISVMVRNNLQSQDNRGALEIGWSFPMSRRIKGYVKLFNGYGESLIDYNQSMQSVGVGVLISDWY